jgi:hypothetical protein
MVYYVNHFKAYHSLLMMLNQIKIGSIFIMLYSQHSQGQCVICLFKKEKMQQTVEQS